jgi:hypothetical protein
MMNSEIYKLNNFLPVSIITGVAMSVFVNFSVFFIGYAFMSFIKARDKEFGIYLTQGMTSKELKKMVIVENLIIVLLSLFNGLIAGTLFSKIFFLVVVRISKLDGLTFELNYKNYFITIALFGLIFAVLVLYTIIRINKLEIMELLKSKKKSYSVSTKKTIICVLGIILMIVALTSLYLNYILGIFIVPDKWKGIWEYIGIIGIYLFVLGAGSFYTAIVGIRRVRYKKNILKISNINEALSRNRNIIFLLTIFGLIVIYYSGYGYSLKDRQSDLGARFNPDIIYVEDYEKQSEVQQMDSIVNDYEEAIEESKKVTFLNMELGKKNIRGSYTKVRGNIGILSESNFNEIAGHKITTKQGQGFVMTNLAKAKQLDIKKYEKLVISSKNKTYELTANSKHYDLIIAKEVFIPDYVVVLHNSDYEQLFKESELEYKKILYTLTISRNFDVEEIVNILKSELTEASNKIVSRRELYAITEREIRLSKFLFTFTEILLFIVSGCILYFNLIMEVSEVKTIYFKLYRIGITDDEIIEVIHSQIRIVLFLPCLLASIIGSLYVTLLTLNEPNTPIYTLSTLSTIVIYVLFYFLIYQIVKSKFIKEIIYADQ